jgi:inhibitor of cysteine peptidase
MRFVTGIGLAIMLLFVAAVMVACSDDGDGNGGSTTPAAPGELQLSDADSGKTFSADAGSTIIVALTSNASTGYAWHVRDPLPSQLTQSGEARYVPPGSTEPVVGAPGTEVFTFRAISAGTAELTLDYVRSFEDGDPASTYAVTIEIK